MRTSTDMRTLTMTAWAVLCLMTLTGCLSSGGRPTPAQIARADYARIAGNANVILFGDALAYRAGTAEAERVPTACREASCSLGFGRVFSTKNFSASDVELEILPGRNGVRLVVERADSKGDNVNDTDVTVFGGWMEYGFFTSQANFYTDEENPNYGATIFYSYALGDAAGENPAAPGGGAEWRGFVVGRDAGVTSSLESVVQGDAAISVKMGPSGMLADVAFTDLGNARTGVSYDDMTWTGMAVTDGGFARRGAVGDVIKGDFYGPNQEEVGGIFERSGIAGAFGGRRSE